MLSLVFRACFVGGALLDRGLGPPRCQSAGALFYMCFAGVLRVLVFR